MIYTPIFSIDSKPAKHEPEIAPETVTESYVSQNKAWTIFGKDNVQLWRKSGKITPSVSGNTLQYNLAELHQLNNSKL